MSLFEANDKELVDALARLSYCNPFLPERIDLERQALSDSCVAWHSAWHIHADAETDNPNLPPLIALGDDIVAKSATRLRDGAKAIGEDARLYEALVIFHLYHHFRHAFDRVIATDTAAEPLPFYADFARRAENLLGMPGLELSATFDADHLLACFFQVRRAFHHIFYNIAGGSGPAVRLRAAVWQSIFTYDMQRYRRSLYTRMGDFTTLITGQSGTGKELVARAVGLSRYVPFDRRTRSFIDAPGACVHCLNLSALSPTLIEAELFGSRKGAFTGADRDHVGWFETCSPYGTVFLDEIGELDPVIQVKLLRLLQTRSFQRLGETESRKFHGKIITATNRNLGDEVQEGRFREDLYYRLCADRIETPTLRQQVLDSPDELGHLVSYLARQIIGDAEGGALATEVTDWVHLHLGPDYAWPGNVRELEQCVRNVLIRRDYQPLGRPPAETAFADALSSSLTLDELISHYCTQVYKETGSFVETARRLQVDRRTVRARVDQAYLDSQQ
ncbi:MAG: transcriptional regulator with AAA-type ATPase domain [Rhodothermales bacterium]